MVDEAKLEEPDLEGPYLEGYDSMILPRKPFDVYITAVHLVSATKMLTRRLMESINQGYPADFDPWPEMDRHWAQREAAFLVSEKPYHQYMPGRYWTYNIFSKLHQEYIQKSGVDLEDSKIAEIGGGSGICLIISATKGVGKVYNVDKSLGALRFSETLAEHYNVRGKIDLLLSDFYCTGYPLDSFDVTFNVGVAEHIKEREKLDRLVNEMARITKPGGIVMIGIPNKRSPIHRFARVVEHGFYSDVNSILAESETLEMRGKVYSWGEEEYDVALDSLGHRSGLEIVEKGATFIAPTSTRIPLSFFDEESLRIYQELIPKIEPKDTMELMKFWRMVESNKSYVPDNLLQRLGYDSYVVLRKMKV